MAENQKKSNSKKTLISSKTLSLIAYIAIGCIAVALLLNLIFKGNVRVASAFSAVGQVIAYIVCIIMAYKWVTVHRQVGWIVCYVIFVVTIIVLFILGLTI